MTDNENIVRGGMIDRILVLAKYLPELSEEYVRQILC